jgi:hypothetical protein
MDSRRCPRSRKQPVWFSPYLLAVALSPALFQTSSTVSCRPRTGDTRLSELAVLVDGENQIAFETNTLTYEVALPPTDEALVRAVAMDPNAQVSVYLNTDSGQLNLMTYVVGGGEVTVPFESGQNKLSVQVTAPGGAFAYYTVSIQVGGSLFACTEQGIRDAIAEGGGPYFFACHGPTTMVTEAEILINHDVILDGEGNLTVDGNENHRIFTVIAGITAELRGFTVTKGVSDVGGGIANAGMLTLTHSTVSRNTAYEAGGGIHNDGTLTITNTTVSGNNVFPLPYFSGASGGGIYNGGDLTLANSTVSGNTAYGGGIYNDGTLALTHSTVSENGIHNSGTLTLANTLVQAFCDADGTTLSGGGNLESPGDTCGLDQPTDLVNVTAEDLSLGPLFSDYGGPTQTHALLRGSVAIDRIPVSMCVDADGQPLTTDQRGVSRPQEAACDVGAFEWVDCTGSVCDDGDECTSDTCSPIDGTCVNLPVADGTACDFEGSAGVCIAFECVETRWGTAMLLETNTGWVRNPQVAVDPNGNATAVWEQWTDTRGWSIWTNRYTPSAGWGTDVAIEMGGRHNPQLAADSNGHVTVVWQTEDYHIGSNRYTPSGGWGTPVLIETYRGDGREPQVAVDSNGHVTAVWQQWDGTDTGIWSNRYTPSGGWGTMVPIFTYTGGGGAAAQVAVDSNGHVTAVWQQWDGTDTGIWSNRYTPSGGWGTPVLIENNRGNTGNPQVAVDSNGNATAVWTQNDGPFSFDGPLGIWSNRYTPSGGWGTPVLIESNRWSAASNPQVAVDSNGHVTAVWQQWGEGDRDIWSNWYTPSAGWGTPVRIESNRGDACNPQVAVDFNGHVTVVWETEGQYIWSNRSE